MIFILQDPQPLHLQMVEREGKEGKGGWRQGSLPGLPPSLVVYVKHAHPDSEKTRLDTWSGTIQPTYVVPFTRNGRATK